ncbi:MAG: hypothetical protein ACI35P_07335 [Bacillus sp. (in: firmicutes)]
MIEKMLTLSTANISKKTAEWLEEQAKLSNEGTMDVSVYEKAEDGWFIPVNERVFTEEIKNGQSIPPEFFDVYNYAVTHDCSWIMIAHEADVVEELPQYNW